jgi:hypothetical protein
VFHFLDQGIDILDRKGEVLGSMCFDVKVGELPFFRKFGCIINLKQFYKDLRYYMTTIHFQVYAEAYAPTSARVSVP